MNRNDIRQIVKEEIMKEGWWDRVKAHSSGVKRGLSQVRKNLGAAAKGEPESFKKTVDVRDTGMASSRLKSFHKKIAKVRRDLEDDLTKMFGKSIPLEIEKDFKSLMTTLNKSLGHSKRLINKLEGEE